MNTKPHALLRLAAPIFTATALFAISIAMASTAFADEHEYPREKISLPLYELPVDEDKILKDIKLKFCISKDACEDEWAEVVIDAKAGNLAKPLVAKLLLNKHESATVEVDLSETWGGGEILFYQIELDETNEHQEILISSYSGGAHCCAIYKVLAVYDDKLSFIDFIMVDGGPGISMYKDGSLFFIDNRFLYAFGSYVDSYSLTKFYKLEQGNKIDLSKQPQYKDFYLKEMKSLQSSCGKVEHLSACAAYAAAAARVGKFDSAWEFIKTNYQQNPEYEEQYPYFCNVEPINNEPCPENEDVKFDNFPQALLHALKEWDYIE